MGLREITTEMNICPYAFFIGTFVKFIDAKIVVEIGVDAGDTAIELIRSVQQTNGKYYGYDYFENIGVYTNIPSKEYVQQKIINIGLNSDFFELKKVNTMLPDFDEMLMADTNGKIDLAFIDGDHSYKGIKNDFEKVYPLLSEDGCIILHDTYSHIGCRKFVIDLYEKYQDGTFDIINLPYGNGHNRYGLTILTKRSYPLYQTGITIGMIEPDGITSDEMFKAESKWYNSEIEKYK